MSCDWSIWKHYIANDRNIKQSCFFDWLVFHINQLQGAGFWNPRCYELKWYTAIWLSRTPHYLCWLYELSSCNLMWGVLCPKSNARQKFSSFGHTLMSWKANFSWCFGNLRSWGEAGEVINTSAMAISLEPLLQFAWVFSWFFIRCQTQNHSL